MAESMAASARKSDLGTRVASAVIMLALAASAFALGGWFFRLFIAMVGLGVLIEWWGLSIRIAQTTMSRLCWMVGGCGYVGLACLNLGLMGPLLAVLPVLGVIGTDVGAYFAGRAIGGPKIAPSISPSKTWAGLGGGIVGAMAMLALGTELLYQRGGASAPTGMIILFAATGMPLAILAQAGDFFESWMKRKAGVKDSGALIPGHGGVFDRVDGLLPVSIVTPVLMGIMFSGARL